MATTVAKAANIVSTGKEFNKVLTRISKSSETLAVDMHIAGMYALRQVNGEHGNAADAQRLIDAIGQKQDIKRIGKWLTHFGKLGIKDGKLIYRKRKDITLANVDGWLKKADETPYWMLTKQPKLEVTYDYLAMVKSIIERANNKAELEEEGKTVTEKNVGVLKKLADILVAFTPADEQPSAKKAAAKAKNHVMMEATGAEQLAGAAAH